MITERNDVETTELEADVRQRVARGVALLDEREDGWDYEIDLETLDVKQPGVCVVGQQPGGWFETLVRLGLATEDDRPWGGYALDSDGIMHHGFNCRPATYERDEQREYDALRGEWLRVIRERRARDAAAAGEN